MGTLTMAERDSDMEREKERRAALQAQGAITDLGRRRLGSPLMLINHWEEKAM